MRSEENDRDDQRTIWCGNLSEQVTDEILYELFIQAGPVESLRRPRDHNGRPKSFAFIVYRHECSVPYALELFKGEKLFNRNLNLSSRSRLQHIPVLDTHLTEFNNYHQNDSSNRKRNKRDDKRSHEAKDEPKSWDEFNALRGKGSLLNSHSLLTRNDLQGPSFKKESESLSGPPGMPDFNMLLQMGQQMMSPNLMGLPGLSLHGLNMNCPPLSMAMPFNFNPLMYPSMQGLNEGVCRSPHPDTDEGRRRTDLYDERMSVRGPPERDGRRNDFLEERMNRRGSPGRDRSRKDFHEERGSRRDHPYNDSQHRVQYNHFAHRHSDNHSDHRRHDRGYSSSRSSHERERRDRRSR